MSSENTNPENCCFDNLLWRQSKDNYSEIPDPEVKNNVYYPYYPNECEKKDEEKIEKIEKIECFNEDDSRKLPGYTEEVPILDGINQECHPEFKYKMSRSEIENLRNQAIFDNKNLNGRLGFILHPKSTRTISNLEMKCCRDDPKKQIEIQNEEVKKDLILLPKEHKTKQLMTDIPDRITGALNNPCSTLANLNCSKNRLCFDANTRGAKENLPTRDIKPLWPKPIKKNCGDIMISSRDIMRGCPEPRTKEIIPLGNTNPLPPVPVLEKAQTITSSETPSECCSPLASWWSPDWKLNVQNHNNWCNSVKN